MQDPYLSTLRHFQQDCVAIVYLYPFPSALFVFKTYNIATPARISRCLQELMVYTCHVCVECLCLF